MRILVLGGTRFVGWHLVQTLLDSGHHVTIFHRGRHPSPFPEVEVRTGDRDGDLSALAEGSWDRVIDVSGYTAPQLRRSVELLGGRIDGYVFVSTTSVYRMPAPAGIKEEGELKEADHGTSAPYGEAKVACEEVLAEELPERRLVVRPGILSGPRDYTDRLSYWCLRVRKGGRVLAPGGPERPVQLLDARDLAAWTVGMVEEEIAGVFNAVGPAEPTTMGSLLDTISRVVGNNAEIVWASDSVLDAAGADRSRELPFWVPETHTAWFTIDASRARRRGLRPRPLEETVRDTLAWLDEEGRELSDLESGPDPAREEELISRAS